MKDFKKLFKYFSNDKGVSTLDIVLIAISGIIIIVSAIIILTNVGVLATIDKTISSERESIVEKEKNIKELKKLESTIENLKAEYKRNNMLIPYKVDKVGILKDITELSEKNEAYFMNIKYYEEASNDNGVNDVPFVIRVDSTYKSLQNFIYELEEMERLYVVESVKIVESSASEDMLSAEIKIHAYYDKNKGG